MNLVLTDDEIAAVAFECHVAWPAPLPTVTAALDDLSRAAARGRRSLLVRELASPIEDSVSIDAQVVDAIQRAADSRCVVTWVASSDQPARLAGSSTVIYRRQDGDLVDLTSGTGIHNLRTNDAAESEALLLAIAKNVFDFGFAGNPQSTARLVVGALDGKVALLISAGRIESGKWSLRGIDVESVLTDWDPMVVQGAIQ